MRRAKRAIRNWFILAAVIASAAACNSPTTATTGSYAGQWSGTTLQNRPIAFTIANDAVTKLTVGYDFNGCSGTQTFSGLSISIIPDVQCIPGPCSPLISAYRSFGYESGRSLTDLSIGVNALLLSPTTAQGTINFRNFAGCADANGVGWSATRR